MLDEHLSKCLLFRFIDEVLLIRRCFVTLAARRENSAEAIHNRCAAFQPPILPLHPLAEPFCFLIKDFFLAFVVSGFAHFLHLSFGFRFLLHAFLLPLFLLLFLFAAFFTLRFPFHLALYFFLFAPLLHLSQFLLFLLHCFSFHFFLQLLHFLSMHLQLRCFTHLFLLFLCVFPSSFFSGNSFLLFAFLMLGLDGVYDDAKECRAVRCLLLFALDRRILAASFISNERVFRFSRGEEHGAFYFFFLQLPLFRIPISQFYFRISCGQQNAGLLLNRFFHQFVRQDLFRSKYGFQWYQIPL